MADHLTEEIAISCLIETLQQLRKQTFCKVPHVRVDGNAAWLLAVWDWSTRNVVKPSIALAPGLTKEAAAGQKGP
jgi:hypothetical protein